MAQPNSDAILYQETGALLAVTKGVVISNVYPAQPGTNHSTWKAARDGEVREDVLMSRVRAVQRIIAESL